MNGPWITPVAQAALTVGTQSEGNNAMMREGSVAMPSMPSQHPGLEPVQNTVLSFGERLADHIAKCVGSWTFIIGQSALLIAWIAANALAWFHAWDPYPFILLNLVLSFQAAYTAPVILMSQNRQAAIDRLRAEDDYLVNSRAEREIGLLHHKIDLLQSQELAYLREAIERLERKLDTEIATTPLKPSDLAADDGAHGWTSSLKTSDRSAFNHPIPARTLSCAG
jgi:uncharacterized membrane protein